jgi:hypothetical protein
VMERVVDASLVPSTILFPHVVVRWDHSISVC